MIELTGNPNVVALDFLTAKQMAETLHSHYPGHLWAVTCEGLKGIATVRNLRLSGRWGFVIKLRDLKADPGMKEVIRAGGELLERYRVSRGRFNPAEFDGELVADRG
jgi:hypothetical protein